MSTESLFVLSIAAAVLLTGGALMYFVYKKLLPKSQVLGTSVLIALSVLVGVVVLDNVGVSFAASPAPLLLLSFLGFLFGQIRPMSKVALCRALAFIAGITAFLAALASDFGATALSLGVTGLLVHIADRQPPVAKHNVREK